MIKNARDESCPDYRVVWISQFHSLAGRKTDVKFINHQNHIAES